jgi:hypothetical protein
MLPEELRWWRGMCEGRGLDMIGTEVIVKFALMKSMNLRRIFLGVKIPSEHWATRFNNSEGVNGMSRTVV